VSFLINSSHAQSLDNFVTYTNNDMNFTIQHPSNWHVKESTESPLKESTESPLKESTESPLKESTESPHGRVWFELSGRSLPIFVVDTEKVEPHFDTDTLTLKNTSLQQLVQHELDEILDLYIEDAIKKQHLPNGFKISDDARTFIKNVIPKLVEDYNDVHVVNYSIMCFFTGYALGNSNK